MDGPRRGWFGTNFVQEVSNDVDRIPEFDVRTGDHFWAIVTMYRADPAQWTDPTHTPYLDTEALVMAKGPFCYYCAQPYSKRIASRRCRNNA